MCFSYRKTPFCHNPIQSLHSCTDFMSSVLAQLAQVGLPLQAFITYCYHRLTTISISVVCTANEQIQGLCEGLERRKYCYHFLSLLDTNLFLNPLDCHPYRLRECLSAPGQNVWCDFFFFFFFFFMKIVVKGSLLKISQFFFLRMTHCVSEMQILE